MQSKTGMSMEQKGLQQAVAIVSKGWSKSHLGFERRLLWLHAESLCYCFVFLVWFSEKLILTTIHNSDSSLVYSSPSLSLIQILTMPQDEKCDQKSFHNFLVNEIFWRNKKNQSVQDASVDKKVAKIVST